MSLRKFKVRCYDHGSEREIEHLDSIRAAEEFAEKHERGFRHGHDMRVFVRDEHDVERTYDVEINRAPRFEAFHVGGPRE